MAEFGDAANKFTDVTAAVDKAMARGEQALLRRRAIERQRKIYEEELETWTKSFNRTKSLAMKERTLNLINDARQKLGTFTGDYRFYQSHFLLPPELRNDKNLQLSDVPFMN